MLRTNVDNEVIHIEGPLTASDQLSSAAWTPVAAGVSPDAYLTPGLVSFSQETKLTMANAHKLDCEAAAADCRFIIQSENEAEALELAKKRMKGVHGQEYTDGELREEHLQVV